MNTLPSFDLYDSNALKHLLEATKESCDSCGQARGWKYTGPFYSEHDDPVICPWCIADSAAASKFDGSFNDGLHSDCKVPLAAPDLALINERTPGFVTWQGNYWWACCGTPCRFMGDATADALQGSWSSIVPALRKDLGEVMSDPDEFEEFLENAERGGSPAVYVFQCRKCSKLHFYWDMD
ncbi:MAG TPA: CbrC family protein [Phycisphaerales bacterium]|nr:CbrC family protein [Phycisphaerales bacterium]